MLISMMKTIWLIVGLDKYILHINRKITWSNCVIRSIHEIKIIYSKNILPKQELILSKSMFRFSCWYSILKIKKTFLKIIKIKSRLYSFWCSLFKRSFFYNGSVVSKQYKQKETNDDPYNCPSSKYFSERKRDITNIIIQKKSISRHRYILTVNYNANSLIKKAYIGNTYMIN